MPMIVKEDFCLTCGQRWLVHRFATAPDFSRPIQRVYRLSKDFNFSTFSETVRHVITFNPSLRLQLVQNKNGWVQHFPDRGAITSEVKVKGITRLFRSIYAGLLIAEEAKAVMDLRNDPPVKAKIVKVNGEHLLSLCVDHIAADGISFDLFERELLKTYEQLINNSTLPQPSSESFIKYLLKEHAQERAQHDNLVYWKQCLKGAPIRTDISIKMFQAPAAEFNYQLTGEVFQFLQTFCQMNSCSVLTVIIACQLLLLSDSGKLNDIVISIPFSNRVQEEDQSIIGNLFVPLHVRFSIIPHEQISQFMSRVKYQILNAILHRQYDYPSLSQFIQEESIRLGANTNLLISCNLIVDDDPTIFPNALFSERLNHQSRVPYKIHRTSFNVEARQSKSILSVSIRWDASTWPIAIGEMEGKFLAAIQKIYTMS
jgi:hypothetical protein